MSSLHARLTAPGPKRILTVEAGLGRGAITRALVEAVERVLAERAPDPAHFRLSDYFDLIAGSADSAALALLLAQGASARAACRTAAAVEAASSVRGRRDERALSAALAPAFAETTTADADWRSAWMVGLRPVEARAPVLAAGHSGAPWLGARGEAGRGPARLAALVRASLGGEAAPSKVRLTEAEPAEFYWSAPPSLSLLALSQASLPTYGLGWRGGRDAVFLVSIGVGARPAGADLSATAARDADAGFSDTLFLHALSEPVASAIAAPSVSGHSGGLVGERFTAQEALGYQRLEGVFAPASDLPKTDARAFADAFALKGGGRGARLREQIAQASAARVVSQLFPHRYDPAGFPIAKPA